MTDFQITLLLVGVICVALVWGFNQLQARRQQKQAEGIFQNLIHEDDPLLSNGFELNKLQEQVDAEFASSESLLSEMEYAEPVEIDRNLATTRQASPTPRPPNLPPAIQTQETSSPVQAQVAPATAHPQVTPTTAHSQVSPIPEPSAQTSSMVETVVRTDVPIPENLIDTFSEWLLPLRLVETTPASSLWLYQSTWSKDIDKSIRWAAFNGNEWVRLDDNEGCRCYNVAAGLQLVDRNGAVTEDQVRSFLQGMHSMAQHFFGEFSQPDINDILEKSEALDEFCLAVDMQVILKVILRLNEKPAKGALQTYADLLDLTPGSDGTLHMLNPNSQILFKVKGKQRFTIASLPDINLQGEILEFSLDVPRVSKGLMAFDRMISAAKRAAGLLGGNLADNRHHLLSDEKIASIRHRISEIQERMAVHDITPGSPRAMRLFD